MTDTFYYADGEKIRLQPSARFVAMRSGEGDSAAAAHRALAERASTMRAPVTVQEIPEYNLTVFVLPNGATPPDAVRAASESLRAMAADSDLAAGPTVLEAEGETSVAGLVPVGEIILRFAETADAGARQKLLEKHKLEVKMADYPEPGADLLTVKGDAIAVANALHESPLVDFAQPNFVQLVPRLSADDAMGDLEGETIEEAGEAGSAAETMAGTASDPGYASQWGLKKIRAPQAWGISQGSPNVSVAIIDEGCDMAHEDIVYKEGWDAYSNDANPQPDGNDAHGTACAGIVAMRRNNGKGGVGVAPGCKIVGIRIARGIGGGFWDTTDAKVAAGIRRAVDLGADVLSNSYSVGQSTVVTNAFVYAQTSGRGGRGCPIAAASGNGDLANAVIYPARLSPSIRGFMAVGASNQWDQRKSKTSADGEHWWGSNYGPQLDVVAPGVQIYTSDISGAAGYGGGNYVPNFNGTSSATPHVAGVMALVLSVDPSLRSWEVEDIIKLSAADRGAPGRDDEFGWGRVDARRAVEAASRLWYSISVRPVFIGAGEECFIRVRARIYNPGINTIRLDRLAIVSHNPTWSAEVDRFDYVPNPGNVLAPRTSQDVRFNNVLLRANGTRASWSYRWSINWNYTYWRPGAPVFPLSSVEPDVLALGAGTPGEAGHAEGGRDGASRRTAEAGSSDMATAAPAGGDSVVIDRQSRSISVVIR